MTKKEICHRVVCKLEQLHVPLGQVLAIEAEAKKDAAILWKELQGRLSQDEVKRAARHASEGESPPTDTLSFLRREWRELCTENTFLTSPGQDGECIWVLEC